MSTSIGTRKPYLAALLRKLRPALLAGLVAYSLPFELTAQNAEAQSDNAQLLSKLAEASEEEAQGLARDIRRNWARSGSASADLLLKRGRDALRAKKPKVAIEHLTALTDHAPDFAEGWHMRASAYYQEKLYGPAIEDLARTLALDPNHFDAIQGLGAIFEQLKDYDRAYEAYAQVLAIHPHHADVLEAMERIEPKVKGPAL